MKYLRIIIIILFSLMFIVCDDTQDSDNEAPTIIITCPHNNTYVSGSVEITADASDNSDLDKVGFYINDVWTSYKKLESKLSNMFHFSIFNRCLVT